MIPGENTILQNAIKYQNFSDVDNGSIHFIHKMYIIKDYIAKPDSIPEYYTYKSRLIMIEEYRT